MKLQFIVKFFQFNKKKKLIKKKLKEKGEKSVYVEKSI